VTSQNLDWVLRSDEPAFRFFTLAEVLDEPEEGGEGAAA